VKKNVVVVGGGTGSFTVLRGLKGREDLESLDFCQQAGSDNVLWH